MMPTIHVLRTRSSLVWNYISHRRAHARKGLFDWVSTALPLLALLLIMPLSAHASPFDTGISNVSTLFTGTAAKAGSLIAVVLGGLGYAFGDPGAKKNLAGVAFGVGIALMAANVITWLWSA